MSFVPRRIAAPLAALLLSAAAAAQSDRTPNVFVAWNRFYDYDEVVDICQRLADAYPRFCTLSILGHSVEGRPLPLLTVQNPDTGPEAGKSALWLDGNVHGNEVQGSEASLYLVWTLLERYGESASITRLVDERVFYVLPMVNPDGRQHWFDAPNTMHSSRSGKEPVDDDGDGLFDEDGADDLDGDGEVLRMRKRVEAGTGTHRRNPEEPRIMDLVPREKRGEWGADYVLLGLEGYDNDGDGLVNEDGAGGYDMNRNWPAGWMPKYVQYGAGDYPFCYPETEAVGRFLLAHPNVAAVQSFHNSGGMILRGPGTAARENYYPSADVQVYDAIANEGTAILPHYRSMVIHKDLYEVHGGFVDWTAEGLGIISFTNELWADSQYFNEEGSRRSEGELKRLQFDDRLMFGETYVGWREVEHPQYGTVEVGGFRKMTGRTPPTFMIEEMLHRNAAFVLFHAEQMPKVSVQSLEVHDGPGELRAVTLTLQNARWIPSRTAVAAEKGIGRPDLVTIEGPDITVVSGGIDADRFDATRFSAVEHEPERIRLERGIPGHGTERIRWWVTGSGPFTVRYDSWKAGTLTATGSL